MRRRGVHRVARVALTAAAALVAACDLGRSSSPACAAQILDAHVLANADNAISALLSVKARGVDSVAVRFAVKGGSLDSVTAAVAASGDPSMSDSVIAPVLGLLPQTEYTLVPVGYAACGGVSGSSVAFTTGALPADLPTYSTSGADPTRGYVAFAASPYGIVIDNTGRVVWYHRFPGGSGLNFQAQPQGRGHYFGLPPGQPARWMEIDPAGTVVRTFGCARNLQPRFHDLIVLGDNSLWLLCDETRSMDLTPFGGMANAQVTGTVVQHVSATGALLFEWNPFDHFAITDLDSLDRIGQNVNWTHGNALDLDSDGNLIVSFRALSEITKINATTGEVIWRMGGRAGQFVFGGANKQLFARQHGVRAASAGALVLLDNLSDPRESRAKRISYDVTRNPPTAWLSASYGSQPPVVALLGGTTQALLDGRTLVAYGNGGRVEEYDASGNVVWRIEGNPGYVFRAQRIRSLYHPGAFGR